MLTSLLLAMSLAQAAPQTAIAGVEVHDVLAPIHVAPVRSLRPMTIAVEAGVNNTSGLGLQLGYHFNPLFAVEVGGGLSVHAAKVGAQARLNLMKTDVTPFVAAGVNYGFGTPKPFSITDRGNRIAVKTDHALAASAVGGVSWVSRSGLTLKASAGWAQLLQKESPLLIKQGVPTARQDKWLKRATGNGPVVALALGYSF